MERNVDNNRMIDQSLNINQTRIMQFWESKLESLNLFKVYETLEVLREWNDEIESID